MLSSDHFGGGFVRHARDGAIESTLRMVTGRYGNEFWHGIYVRLYEKYDDKELFRKVAAIAADSACEKLLALLASGQFMHTPVAGDPDLTHEMFRNGGWVDRFSIFGRNVTRE